MRSRSLSLARSAGPAPLVAAALVLANAAVFALELALLAAQGESALGELFETWGLVPRELLRGLRPDLAAPARLWLTPLTAMFLHGGLLHLAGNLLYLWIFGAAVEAVLGHARFALLYAGCGIAAAAVQVASDPHSFAATVGASGAVSGVLGAWAVSHPTRRLRLAWPPLTVPAALLLLAWVALQLLSALGTGRGGAGGSGGSAWAGHLGGFAAGAALGRSLWVRRPTSAGSRS
jgi:membrane associated rhomboid family serine protease